MIKEKEYPYFVSSKKSKVSTQYVGNLEAAELKKLEANIALRRKYQQQLKEVRANIDRISRILNAGKKSV